MPKKAFASHLSQNDSICFGGFLMICLQNMFRKAMLIYLNPNLAVVCVGVERPIIQTE